MKIKNWSEFQHFKDRTPPWIKLYRHLLDDPDWHNLDGDDAKTLIMLWLIASEDKDMEGKLPDAKKISFRLRVSEKELNQTLIRLSDWLIYDDNEMISNVYQDDAPETEKRQSKEEYSDDFLKFYFAYPVKTGKGDAYKSWKKLKPNLDEVLNAISWQSKTQKWIEGYIPNPSTYLNQRRWEDDRPAPKKVELVM